MRFICGMYKAYDLTVIYATQTTRPKKTKDS